MIFTIYEWKYKSFKFLHFHYFCLPDWTKIRKIERNDDKKLVSRHTWNKSDILNTSPCPPINLNECGFLTSLRAHPLTLMMGQELWDSFVSVGAGSFCPWPVTKSGPPTFWLCCMPWEAWTPPSHPKKINLLEGNHKISGKLPGNEICGKCACLKLFHSSPHTRLHLCYIPTYVLGQGDRVHSIKISLNSLAVNVKSADFCVVVCIVYFLCFSPNTVHYVPYTPRLYATFEASSLKQKKNIFKL